MLFYALLFAAYVGVAVASWRRHRDVLHPNVFFPPLFAFLYVYMPLALVREDPIAFRQFTGDLLWFYHGLTLVLPLLLMFGVHIGSRRGRVVTTGGRDPLRIANPKRLWNIGLLIGVIGAVTWLVGIGNAGGFIGAYGEAYGGGNLGSGYARELRNVGLLGALLVFVARRGRRMRPFDWIVIAICISPTLLHGLLGARRGPFFISAMVLGGGYVFILGRRLSIATAALLGLGVGITMLFLVANRGSIYIGSDFSGFRSGLDYVVRWNSNEYLIGNAVVAYTQENGGFYGLRQLAHLIGRLVPSAIWPSVYTDVTSFFGLDINLRQNAGVDQLAIANTIGWMPSVGSAMGFVGAFWLEFQYLAPIAVFAVGWFYGRTWRRSRIDARTRVFYIMLCAVSVYLVMQDTDAWLYRAVLFFILTVLLFPRARRARPAPSQRAW